VPYPGNLSAADQTVRAENDALTRRDVDRLVSSCRDGLSSGGLGNRGSEGLCLRYPRTGGRASPADPLFNM